MNNMYEYYFTDAEYDTYRKKQVQNHTIFYDKLITRIIGIIVAICFTVWLLYRALHA